MIKKIAVIGASGMVASRFVDLTSKDFDITSLDEKILDITNKDAVEAYFDKNKFDSIVNFAAYTNVDGAERERGKEGIVWKLNVEAVKNLIEACNKNNIFLIHISTDFVFPGNDNYPGSYSEDNILQDVQDGVGWYGWTKRIAEKEVLESGMSSAIVRYGYPFRAAPYDLKKDWARNLLSLYNEQKLYPLFDDQIYNLLFIDDLVVPLSKIINDKLIGIFHIASSNTTTPYESGKYLLEKYVKKEVKIKKGSMVEFLKTPGRTPRPRLGGLNSLKTQNTLNIKFKTWQEMIDEFISQLR